MAVGELEQYSNKLAVMQVLAGLIKNPLLFMDNDYSFQINDFPEQFHKIVFGAVEHLADQGMEKIDCIDIDQFLKAYPVQYKVFINNRGIEYIQKLMSLYNPDKFRYYYNTLKKYSLLNQLNKDGIETLDIYNPDEIDPVKLAENQAQFDSLSVNDIILNVETKIINIKDNYAINGDVVQSKAGDQVKELIESLKKRPEMGLPLTSPKLTTILRGLRLGAFYVESAPQGVGKSRRHAAESAHVAVPQYFDTDIHNWIDTGICQPTLLISTELELDEVQTMWLAFISGVPEDHILDGRYKRDEEKRVLKAAEFLKTAPLYFVSVSNYNIDDIENIIKKYYQVYGVKYIFYDYLSSTMKIMQESSQKTRISGLREDQILLMFCTRLKDLAKVLSVSIYTSTQLSGDWRNAKEADQQLIRGARAIADKPDCMAILLPVRESDQSIIDAYTAKGFTLTPTNVLHIFKVRRGSFNNIRLYVNYDKSTCRMTDLFVTDNNGVMLEVADTNVEIVLDKTKEKDLDNAVTQAFKLGEF